LTHVVDGEPRIVSDPPLIVPVEELLTPDQAATFLESYHELLRTYRRSLLGDRRHLLEDFRFVHMAHKVVGVGSVGTRAWIILMLGRDDGDPLFLQAKEAQDSVLAPFVGKSRFANQGQRVVEGQRLMQAASDIFLGWERAEGLSGGKRDFYIRQLRDWKGSWPPEAMDPRVMSVYGRMCARTLARAHARSGDRIAIAAYLGASDVFDRSIAGSPRPTPIRTSGTIRRSRTRPRAGGSSREDEQGSTGRSGTIPTLSDVMRTTRMSSLWYSARSRRSSSFSGTRRRRAPRRDDGARCPRCTPTDRPTGTMPSPPR
jgi:hypothetical protein